MSSFSRTSWLPPLVILKAAYVRRDPVLDSNFGINRSFHIASLLRCSLDTPLSPQSARTPPQGAGVYSGLVVKSFETELGLMFTRSSNLSKSTHDLELHQNQCCPDDEPGLSGIADRQRAA
jgi:hypothetical protein